MAISTISSFIVIFSPGTTSRQDQYTEGGNFFYSLKMAILSSGMFTLKNLLELPILLVMSGFPFLLLHWSKNLKDYLAFNPLSVLFISFVGLASVVFVPYYATGYLYIRGGRIGNMIYIVWWILFFINALNIALYLKKNSILTPRISGWTPFVMLSFFLFFTLTENRTYQNLFADFRSGSFLKFENDIATRTQKIISSGMTKLEVEQIRGTRTMSHVGISKEPLHWTNTCYITAMNKIYKTDYKEIFLKNEEFDQ